MSIQSHSPYSSGSAEQYPPLNDATTPEHPMTSFRHFMDTINQFDTDSDQDFVERITATREPTTIRFLGSHGLHEIELNPREVVFSEMKHCLIDTDGIPFGLSDERSIEVDEAVRASARLVRHEVNMMSYKIVKKYYKQHGKTSKETEQTLPIMPILASKVWAAVGHDGEKRNSGRDYWHHPEEATAIDRKARKKIGYSLSSTTYIITQCMEYAHDIIESNTSPTGMYVGSGMPMTPLVGKYILGSHNVPDQHNGGRSLFYLTRAADAFGNKMDYQLHDRYALHQSGTLGRYNGLIKNVDRLQNLKFEAEELNGDEVRDARITKNAAKYIEAMNYTAAMIGPLHGDRYAKLIEAQNAVTQDELADELTMNYPLKLDKIAYRVKAKIAKRLKMSV